MLHKLGLYIFIYLYLAHYSQPLHAISEKTLTIISPHRSSIKNEFIKDFESFYKKKFHQIIKVEWIDQGGASQDLRYIISRYNNNKKTKNNIGIDIFWGGGEAPHLDLEKRNLLEKISFDPIIKKQIPMPPKKIGGTYLVSPKGTWSASLLSIFGIFYNKIALKIDKISAPNSWQDLSDKKYYNKITSADPRKSSSAILLCAIILESYEWQKAWQLLTSIAINTYKFRNSSTDPIKSVIRGESSIAPSIGYFAFANIHSFGEKKLGFVIPPKQTVINADPISILKGAPNKKAANAFINFILSTTSQKKFLLAKGTKSGPRYSTLGRMSVNPYAYNGIDEKLLIHKINPFKLKIKPLDFDFDTLSKIQLVLADLIGTIHVDTHRELKKSWGHIQQRKISQQAKEALSARLSLPLVSKKELLTHAQNWQNSIYRNKQINNWTQTIKKRYSLFDHKK